MAQRQHKQGRRAKLPVFSPIVATDDGEYGPAADEFMKWVVKKY